MGVSPQKRALETYRARLSARGMARFEVLGLEEDRALIRTLARRLADDGPEAAKLRAVVNGTINGTEPQRGGVLAALRRWPLDELNLARPREAGRKVDL